MFLSSFFYERTVLSHLERIQCLPENVQAEIASRLRTYIKLARVASTEAVLTRIASTAVEEKTKAIKDGVISTMDPRWAAPALAEAWCQATIGLANSKRSRASAMAIIGAIEAFASE